MGRAPKKVKGRIIEMRARNLMTILIVMSGYVKTNSQEVARCKRCAVCEGPWQGAPDPPPPPFRVSTHCGGNRRKGIHTKTAFR